MIWKGKVRLTSPALGSDDSSLDQSAMSIQILLRSRDTLFLKLRLYTRMRLFFPIEPISRF